MGVAQLAEHRTVAPDVVGSIPISHPNLTGLDELLISFAERTILISKSIKWNVARDKFGHES